MSMITPVCFLIIGACEVSQEGEVKPELRNTERWIRILLDAHLPASFLPYRQMLERDGRQGVEVSGGGGGGGGGGRRGV